MKRIFILMIYAVCTFPFVHAQQVIIQEDIPISQQLITQAFFPVLNEMGTQLLYTQANFKGLYSYHLQTKEQRVLSEEAGSGYEPAFSADNESVFYKIDRPKEGRRYKLLMRYDYASWQAAPVSKDLRKQSDIRKARQTIESTTASVSVASEDLQLVIYRDGERLVLDPVKETSGYIWVSLSPDKKRILFTAATKGTFVADLTGNVIAELGDINAPVWFGNDMIVGMKDHDNGAYITKSMLWLKSLDGHINQAITPDTTIALYPTASAQAGKIVYQTEKGQLRLLTVMIR